MRCISQDSAMFRCEISSGFRTSKVIEIGSFFIKLFKIYKGDVFRDSVYKLVLQ